MMSEANKNSNSKIINSTTDRSIIRQYLDLNYSDAQMSYGIVKYKHRNKVRKINVADLIWELNAVGIIAPYKTLKTILTNDQNK